MLKKLSGRDYFFIVLMIALIISGVLLGNWQLRRAEFKETQYQKRLLRGEQACLSIDSDKEFFSHPQSSELEFRKLCVRGKFIKQWPIYLENRPYQGRAGLYVLMPLQIENSSQVVLVVRGWMPRFFDDRNKISAITTLQQNIAIEGYVSQSAGKLLTFANEGIPKPGQLRLEVTPLEFEKALGLKVYPFYLLQTNVSEDGLIRDWPFAPNDSAKHYGYAVQWFGLSLIGAIFLIILFRSKKAHANK